MNASFEYENMALTAYDILLILEAIDLYRQLSRCDPETDRDAYELSDRFRDHLVKRNLGWMVN